jgi:magnesium transporter
LAWRELEIKGWWRVALREIPNGVALGVMLGLWQSLGFYDYGEHWMLIALTVGAPWSASSCSARSPDPCSRSSCNGPGSSAPFVATLVDVTGLVIYFTVASLILQGML